MSDLRRSGTEFDTHDCHILIGVRIFVDMTTVSNSSTAKAHSHGHRDTRPPFLPRISDAAIYGFRIFRVEFPTDQPVESFCRSLAPWPHRDIWPCTDAHSRWYRLAVSIAARTWGSRSRGICARSCDDTSMEFYIEIGISVVLFSSLDHRARILPYYRIYGTIENVKIELKLSSVVKSE